MDMLVMSMGDNMYVLKWGAVISASLVAFVSDIRHRRISNALTFSLLVTGLVWAGWFGGLSGLGEAIGACLLVGGPYVLLFIFAGGGAGDAKLMGAIGSWLGLQQGIIVLLCVAVAGGILALVKATLEKRLKIVLTTILLSFYSMILWFAGGRKAGCANRRDEPETKPNGPVEMPYGVAIVVGVCIAAAIVAFGGKEWLRLW